MPLSDFVQYTYSPDIATFAQSAQQAIVQFKAAGVTTVIVGVRSVLGRPVDQGGGTENYSPEWFLEGTALTDEDQAVADLRRPPEVTGHLFGMSELSPPTETSGPSLAGRQALQETDRPHHPQGDRRRLCDARLDLRRAPGGRPRPHSRQPGPGPALDPRPRRAPIYPYGKWGWNIGPSGQAGGGDHTAGVDARFVWWNGDAVSPINGKKGTYVPAFGGKRFSLGEWPTHLPPMFTDTG